MAAASCQFSSSDWSDSSPGETGVCLVLTFGFFKLKVPNIGATEDVVVVVEEEEEDDDEDVDCVDIESNNEKESNEKIQSHNDGNVFFKLDDFEDITLIDQNDDEEEDEITMYEEEEREESIEYGDLMRRRRENETTEGDEDYESEDYEDDYEDDND
mmetsp:Transcript_18901/g.22462  ORF Transcript_18901/g.22462 Transcript_18901/m.22462 type:complete len:157 (+) Transcript_18901:221-691(+)